MQRVEKSFDRRTKRSGANSAERFSQGCQNRWPLRAIFRKGIEKPDEIVDNDLWELGAGNSWQCSSEPKHIVPVNGWEVGLFLRVLDSCR